MRFVARYALLFVLAYDFIWVMNRVTHLLTRYDNPAALAQAMTDPATWWPAIAIGVGAGLPLLCIVLDPYLLERADFRSRP